MGRTIGHYYVDDLDNIEKIDEVLNRIDIPMNQDDVVFLVGDIIVEPEGTTEDSIYLRRAKKYSYLPPDLWVYHGEYNLESINPLLEKQHQRALNVFEDYGTGVLPSFYASIYAQFVSDFNNNSVGVSKIEDKDLLNKFNTYTGNEVQGSLPRTGLLPVFILDENSKIVGSGTAVYTNKNTLSLNWYKIETSVQKTRPFPITSSMDMWEKRKLIMFGDSSVYNVTLKKEDSTITLSSSYDGENDLTFYNIPSFIKTGDILEIKNELGLIEKTYTYYDGIQNSISLDDLKIEQSYYAVFLSKQNHRYEEPLKNIIYPATTSISGIMTPKYVNDINDLKQDVSVLKNTGGNWIGKNYNTKEDLDDDFNTQDDFDGININDFTYIEEYVEEDGEPRRALFSVVEENGDKSWVFNRFETVEPIKIATAEAMGLVKSSEDMSGYIKVIQDDLDNDYGRMRLNGYDDIISRLDALESILYTMKTLDGQSANLPGGGYKNLEYEEMHLIDYLTEINKAFSGIRQIRINLDV